jgi:hypothetical protein
MFCNGAIERTATGRLSAKSDSHAKDAVFSFLLYSSAQVQSSTLLDSSCILGLLVVYEFFFFPLLF